jgi:hypothetical protein
LVIDLIIAYLQKLEKLGLKDPEVIDNQINCQTESGIKIKLSFVKKAELGWEMISRTGNPEHAETLKAMLKGADVLGMSEAEIYELAGLPSLNLN